MINRLPGVKEVCVVGIDDHEENQKPAACVVRQEGSVVTAQEIKDFVASKFIILILQRLFVTQARKVAFGPNV